MTNNPNPNATYDNNDAAQWDENLEWLPQLPTLHHNTTSAPLSSAVPLQTATSPPLHTHTVDQPPFHAPTTDPPIPAHSTHAAHPFNDAIMSSPPQMSPQDLNDDDLDLPGFFQLLPAAPGLPTTLAAALLDWQGVVKGAHLIDKEDPTVNDEVEYNNNSAGDPDSDSDDTNANAGATVPAVNAGGTASITTSTSDPSTVPIQSPSIPTLGAHVVHVPLYQKDAGPSLQYQKIYDYWSSKAHESKAPLRSIRPTNICIQVEIACSRQTAPHSTTSSSTSSK